MNLLLSGAYKYKEVAAALASILRQEAVTPLDVNKLYSSYSSSDPPPITFLQSPMVLLWWFAWLPRSSLNVCLKYQQK
jgi:hypothetical protein